MTKSCEETKGGDTTDNRCHPAHYTTRGISAIVTKRHLQRNKRTPSRHSEETGQATPNGEIEQSR